MGKSTNLKIANIDIKADTSEELEQTGEEDDTVSRGAVKLSENIAKDLKHALEKGASQQTEAQKLVAIWKEARKQPFIRPKESFALFHRYNELKTQILAKLLTKRESMLALVSLFIPRSQLEKNAEGGRYFGYQYFTTPHNGDLNFDPFELANRSTAELYIAIREYQKNPPTNMEDPEDDFIDFDLNRFELCYLTVKTIREYLKSTNPQEKTALINKAVEYISDIKISPMLLNATAEFTELDPETQKLFQELKALHKKLTSGFINQVCFWSFPAVRSGYKTENCIEAGTKGLIRGIDTYDPRNGKPFWEYCHAPIRQAIGRMNEAETKKPGTKKERDKLTILQAARHEAAMLRGTEDVEVLSEMTGFSIEEIYELEKLNSHRETSFDTARDEDSRSMSETIATATLETPEDIMIKKTKGNLETWLQESGLDDREKDIMIKRTQEHLTLEEIGTIYGLTRERIRQVEVKAEQKLKNYFERKSIHLNNF